MNPRMLLVTLAVALAGAAHAGGDVFRWVDEQGHTQFGDSVPERYARVARKVDTSGTELTERDRLAAEARRQQVQDDADAVAKAKEARRRQAAEAAPPPDPDGLGGSVFIIDNLPKRPEPACRAKVRAFEESLNCFAQYRNANGTVQPEGFARCRNVPAPPPCR